MYSILTRIPLVHSMSWACLRSMKMFMPVLLLIRGAGGAGEVFRHDLLWSGFFWILSGLSWACCSFPGTRSGNWWWTCPSACRGWMWGLYDDRSSDRMPLCFLEEWQDNYVLQIFWQLPVRPCLVVELQDCLLAAFREILDHLVVNFVLAGRFISPVLSDAGLHRHLTMNQIFIDHRIVVLHFHFTQFPGLICFSSPRILEGNWHCCYFWPSTWRGRWPCLR